MAHDTSGRDMAEVIAFDIRDIDSRPDRAVATDVLGDETRAFDLLLPELLTTHRGRYVAILGGRVVGSGSDLFAVLKQAYADHGHRPILVRLVTDAPPRVLRA